MSKELERLTGEVSIKRYFDTDYIGAYSIDDGIEPILTIDSLWYGELTLGGGRKETHVIVKFKEKKVAGVDDVKPLILNATNRKTLKKLFGDDSAMVLEGKRIQLYIDPKVRDPQDGGFTEGLRIRPYVPKVEGVPKCTQCKNEVTAAGNMSAVQVVALGQKRKGEIWCAACLKKEEAEKKAAEAAAAALEPSAPEETEAANDSDE